MGNCMFMRKGETHTKPSFGIPASDLATGSVVKLMENGVATEYLIVNKGKPSGSPMYDDSCDGLWLLRKYLKENRQWNSSNVNDYKNSTVHAWLNGDFFNQLGAVEQSVIKQVKIPYVSGPSGSPVSSGANGLSTRVFLLSMIEVGFTVMNSNVALDGAKLDYFVLGSGQEANEKRVAQMENEDYVTDWHLRSPNIGTSYREYVYAVMYNGSFGQGLCASSLGKRPALILPLNAIFDKNTLALKGVF